ncbi:glyoxalase [Nocardia sp. ET3-3]|uniref:Glyoxalase n=1 Tax=Nocardia terrae TaxID=2675851 RepID=A0A7K1V9N3_9NOCA|nr:VOC family protein [Nocardia terrae]MVU83296.1 glyoxalase [Nocardia terrae]
MTQPTFTSVLTVAVPVTDQDRTKELFETLGSKTIFDRELQPGFRWLTLELPGGTATLSLILAGPELPTGIDTGVRLSTPDARAAHATLTGLGLQVGDLLDWESAPLMFVFRDPDGNRFYVTEPYDSE